MKKLLGIVVLGLLLTSCTSVDFNAESPVNKWVNDEQLAKVNSSRLILLEKGMSKSQVFNIMGTDNAMHINNPYLVSLFNSGEDNITVIYYFTKNPNNAYEVWNLGFHNMTPLVLLNGKLIGWGEESLRRAMDQYDLEINID